MVTAYTLVYNHKNYIRQCLEGLVMQETNFRYECFVHDDASPDGSGEIVKEYAEKYPDKIVAICQTENQYSKHDGSLKRIINEHIHGKYVAICEGDDYWTDPTKLQRQVDFLESHPKYTMCFHDAEVKAEKGRMWYDCFGKLEDRDYEAPELIKYWKVPTHSIVVRKEVFFSRPQNDKFRMGDNVLIMTCLTHGKVRCLGRKMGVYRLTPTSWLGTHTGKKNCYAFISHYKGMVEEFPLCRCEEMYQNMENQYFSLMTILKQESNKEEFERVKDDYMHYPGTPHWDRFTAYYRKEMLRSTVKRLLGSKLSTVVSMLKERLGLNKK